MFEPEADICDTQTTHFHVTMSSYENSVYLAKLAEQAERYEGMYRSAFVTERWPV